MPQQSLASLLASYFASHCDAWGIAPMLGMDSCDPARLDSLLSGYSSRIASAPRDKDAIIDEAIDDVANRTRI